MLNTFCCWSIKAEHICCFFCVTCRECSKCVVSVELYNAYRCYTQTKSHVRIFHIKLIRTNQMNHFCLFLFLCVLFEFLLELDKTQWSELGWAKTFRQIWEGTRDNCERINGCQFSCKEFVARYEAIYKPVVITNLQVC